MSDTPDTGSTSLRAHALGRGPIGFLNGASYPLRGIAFLLRHPKLWPAAVLPALVTLLTLIAMLTLAWFGWDDVLARLRPDVAAENVEVGALRRFGGAAWQALLYPLAIIVTFGGALVAGLALAAVLAGPLQEHLSEVVEKAAGGAVDSQPFTVAQAWKDGVRGVLGTVQRLFIFLGIYVPLLALSLIPVVGLAFAAATIVYSMFFLGVNFTAPTLERRKLNLRAKVAWARADLAPFLGFGAACLGLLAIPLAAFVITPGLVAGGALLWLSLGGDRSLESPSAGEPR